MRRPSVTLDIEHGGIMYAVTLGFADGAPREVFCRARKPDSHADLVADDVSVILSLALQHGIPVSALGHSIGRLDGAPASIVGALVDVLAEHTKESPA